MNEKYLTHEQNTCAARIFLNTFGLTLENVSDINEFSKIKIFDKVMNEVGELHFDNGKCIMSANYNKSILEASFDIVSMSVFLDEEYYNDLFVNWSSKIVFQVQKGDNQTIDGEFLINNAIDSEFGINCHCHPLINFTILGKDKATIQILRDGITFGIKISSGDYSETIEVMPWDKLNGFLLHDIIKGEYNNEKYKYPYRRYAGIFNGGESEEFKDKLHVFLSEEEHSVQLNFHNEFVPKVGDDKSKALLQKGHLMQQLDPTMFKKIEEMKKLLLIGDISLLDNLISVCYENFTDEELFALLGVKRQQMNYQDGADSLIHSYYGIGENSCFFSLETQKKLLKK